MTWDGPDRLRIDARGCDRLLRLGACPCRAPLHRVEFQSQPAGCRTTPPSWQLSLWITTGGARPDGFPSFWVVSDIFEEGRQGDTPFHGGFGLVNIQGLKKASYHGYWFLSRLGEEVVAEGHSAARRFVRGHPAQRWHLAADVELLPLWR